MLKKGQSNEDKFVDQWLRHGYKPKKIWPLGLRMIIIKGKELEKKKLAIPPL